MMMKKNILHTIAILACCTAIASCRPQEMDISSDSYDLTLRASVHNVSGNGTRTALLNADSTINSLKLYGWEDGNYWIKGVNATYSSGEWTVPGSFKLSPACNYAFLAYSNLPADGASLTDTDAADGDITYTVTDIAAAQSDVLLGKASVENPTSGEVTVDFSHPYASVIFKVGNITGVSTIRAISLAGIYNGGSTTFSQASEADANGVVQYEWTPDGDADAVLELTGLEKTEGDSIASFVVIPQNLEENAAIVTVNYGDEGKKLTQILSKGKWIAGYTTTYTLGKIGEMAVNISTTTITNNGTAKIYVRAAVAGAWYDEDGNVAAPWSISDGTFDGGFPNTGWENVNGICYYGAPLDSGESAAGLFGNYTAPEAPGTGLTLKLDVLVQAIPYDVNKTCREAFEAL